MFLIYNKANNKMEKEEYIFKPIGYVRTSATSKINSNI
jgi:hypothetical protein